jgi:hypothetical protein
MMENHGQKRQQSQWYIFYLHEINFLFVPTATTKTGLKVFASILNRVYETGRKVVEGFKESMRIVF